MARTRPLASERTTQWASTSGIAATSRSATIDYCYWGADKYYQQKAVKDQAGRYSYTDYYDSSAAAGSKGQTYRVYDPKNAAFNLDTTITPPSGTASSDYWKYQLEPSSDSAYSAQFAYDGNGRPTDVYKLQKTTTNPWSYVRTHTEYGASNDGSWGQASQVIEDYGGIARLTQNNAYTSWGKACDVTDAAGHRFATSYDQDGNVLGVTKDGSAVATYAYGTSGVSNGQVTAVADGLSGVSQSISYATSGGGIGQPSSVSETDPSGSYTTSYTYTSAGDRATATYATPSGTTKWQYADYATIGDPPKVSRAFQTLRQLNPTTGAALAEEFHYSYDTGGLLMEVAFAQTPASGFTPSGTNPWYDSSHLASSRARVRYIYDAGGRPTELDTYWDTRSGSSYTSELVAQDQCSYELTGASRGLKTASLQGLRTATGGTWVAEQNATYGYDAQLDYLTSATYGDGLPNASATWTYDAAGNRNDAVTDNLNRATSIGGVGCTNDILGNRLTKGAATYAWDVLNRLHTYASGGITTTYTYRADGMRVSKSDSTGSAVYRYDGQMLMQDVETPSPGTQRTITDYALGARGIDGVSKTAETLQNGQWVASPAEVGYPIYDAHGNRTATLTKNGTSFSLTDVRTYDAWGNVRVGAQTGRPRARYCANLGHVQDDESNLIYMRARYYEPGSGRFVSEDPARNGANWFCYCGGDPINKVDSSGSHGQHLDAFSESLYQALLTILEGRAIAIGAISVLIGFASSLAVLTGNEAAWVGIGIAVFGIACAIFEYILAPYIADGIVDAVDFARQEGGFAPAAGLTGLGEAGLMLAGLGMGLSEGDADAWVWGF